MFGRSSNQSRPQVEEINEPAEEQGRTYVYNNGRRYSVANDANPQLINGTIYVNGQPLN
jgi:hypothetical protein